MQVFFSQNESRILFKDSQNFILKAIRDSYCKKNHNINILSKLAKNKKKRNRYPPVNWGFYNSYKPYGLTTLVGVERCCSNTFPTPWHSAPSKLGVFCKATNKKRVSLSTSDTLSFLRNNETSHQSSLISYNNKFQRRANKSF